MEILRDLLMTFCTMSKILDQSPLHLPATALVITADHGILSCQQGMDDIQSDQPSCSGRECRWLLAMKLTWTLLALCSYTQNQ